MKIIGAGLAGCIAGAMNQNATIIESRESGATHKALLRFRSPDIGDAVGIPFKKVKVYKGIWHNDSPVQLSPRYIALYSRKVSDKISYRSICNQDAVDRYVAPINFHDMLIDQVSNRIEYGVDISSIDIKDNAPIVSTLPMFVLAEAIGEDCGVEFENSVNKITVSRYRVPDCNVYMTYYYTDPTCGPYRASIDGDVLIIESMWNISDTDVDIVKRSFGLTGITLETIVENYNQPNGKISSIDEGLRRKFIVEMTMKYRIYSLGRFATWRNIVLDDVYKDILQIKQLINKDDYYHKISL